jgi:2'-5' RNA ligase
MANMYFIALVAPQEINEEVLKWKNFMKERFDCSVALRSPAHITLIPPFWMDESLEEKLQTTISVFSQSQASFEINLKNFAAFKPRVVFVEVIANQFLETLHTRLVQFLIESHIFPIEKEERPYHPHVTIATRDLHKKSFHQAWEIFKEKQYKASWLTLGISLLKHNQKKWDVIFTSQFLN